MIDSVLHNATIVTVDSGFTVLEQGAVSVRNGQIEAVWTPVDGEPLPHARETIDLQGGILMPGLVNGHTHMPMSLFRGLADDLPLDQWLNEHIFPAEARHISPASVKVGAQLACAEMLLGGTTTCCDGYFLVAHFLDAVATSGIRAVLAQGVIDFPAPGVPDPSLNVQHAADYVRQTRQGRSHIQPSIFCHSPYTCSTETLTSAKKAASDLGVLFQIHIAETRTECDQILSAHGCSPVRYLDRLGLLDPQTLLVHGVWMTAEDIELIARTGAGIIHCPESNMKLASGVAPIPDCLTAGIRVGLGTDSCASNNDLNMWAEMDSTAKLHKVQRLDPTVMDAQTVIRMATIQGAGLLGMDHLIGSIETGKRADLIVIDLNHPHATPLYQPASHLVYAARASDVSHVMIDGQWIVKDRQLLTMDPDSIISAANRLKESVQAPGPYKT